MIAPVALCEQLKPLHRAALIRTCGTIMISPPRLFALLDAPARSGQTNHHRQNQGGNSPSKAALHRLAVLWLRWEEQTQAYAEGRTNEGLSKPKK